MGLPLPTVPTYDEEIYELLNLPQIARFSLKVAERGSKIKKRSTMVNPVLASMMACVMLLVMHFTGLQVGRGGLVAR